jgi:heme A synthase
MAGGAVLSHQSEALKMISLLIGLIIFALFVYVAWWVLNMIPMPQPIRVVVTVVFVLIVLLALMNYMPGLSLPRGRFLH